MHQDCSDQRMPRRTSQETCNNDKTTTCMCNTCKMYVSCRTMQIVAKARCCTETSRHPTTIQHEVHGLSHHSLPLDLSDGALVDVAARCANARYTVCTLATRHKRRQQTTFHVKVNTALNESNTYLKRSARCAGAVYSLYCCSVADPQWAIINSSPA